MNLADWRCKMNSPSSHRALTMTNLNYISEIEDGVYRIDGTRVSLDSIVYAFWRGDSAETIADSFPAVTLEQVYGAIAFYLSHQAEIDAYLERGDAEFEQLRQQARQSNPLLYKQ